MLKDKLSESNFILGTWCEIPSPYSINIIAKAQMDFVIIDMEHGVHSYDIIQNMVFAAESEGCSVVIRVPNINESYILRALDTGAEGIIIPQVECIEDVEKIIEYAMYAPIGNRGFNPYIKAGGYGNVCSDYFEVQNNKVCLAIILETKRAFENLEEILKNPYISIIYIGQYDLSIALGVPGDVTNRLVVETLERSIRLINKAGKIAGCMVHSPEEATQLIHKGLKFVVYKADTGIIYSAYHSFNREVNGDEII